MLKKRKETENGSAVGSGTSSTENSYVPRSSPGSADDLSVAFRVRVYRNITK